MALPEAQDQRLQQYFDGELAPAQAAEVKEALERDPSLRAQYEALAKLRELITLSAEDLASEVDFDALYNRVDRDIQAAQDELGVFARLSKTWKERFGFRPLWVVAPAGALAAAAIVALVVLRTGSPDATPPRAVAPPAEGPEPGARAEAESDLSRYRKPDKAKVAYAQNSEVVQVDFGDKTGTVFEIALAEGVSTPVVWINDEE